MECCLYFIDCISEFATFVRFLTPQVPHHVPHPCVETLVSLWPMIDQLLEQYGHHEQISGTICRMLRNCMNSYKEHFLVLLPMILQKLATMFERTGYSCFVWVAGHSVRCYGSDDKPEGKLVYSLAQEMTRIVFNIVQNPDVRFEDLEEGLF